MALVPERAWVPERLDAPPFWPLARAFASLREHGEWPDVEALDRALAPGLTNHGGAPLRFEHQAPKPSRRRGLRCRDELYDARIDREGVVPTRARSWHDLFNALVWATFPRAKAALAWRQHRALLARLPETFERLPPTRTAEQDALTLLDEGGGLVVVAHGSGEEVARRIERGVLAPEPDVGLAIFGHAVYEHVLSTDAPLRVGAYVIEVAPEHARAVHEREPSALVAIDEALATRLGALEVLRSIGTGVSLDAFRAPTERTSSSSAPPARAAR